jgi:monofunctional chorismate mutase
MSGDIAALRQELDEIDREFVKLFERRMEVSRRVAEYKRENNLPELDANREEQVLYSRVEMLTDKTLEQSARSLFMEIMRLSRLAQESMLNRGDDL